MKRTALAGLGGLLLALGLGVAGLTDPRRIVGFLDFTGRWDPTALLVLAAAATVFAVGYRLHLALARANGVSVPPAPVGRVDRALVTGALIFGVGWGLSGLCPAPAFVSLAAGTPEVQIFLASLVAGMLLHSFTAGRAKSRVQQAEARPGGP